MSRTRATSAPSASMVMRLPLPAASIITPMMLFAFTRRPLRDSHTSEAKPLATCVSLAAARACSPSLLTISASVRGIADLGIQSDHAVASAAHRLLHDGGERLLAIGERSDQHRQAGAREALDPARREQARRDVGGRRAEDVGQHQHALAAVELAHQPLGLGEDGRRIVVNGHAELLDLKRPFAEHVARAVNERLAESAMRDDQNSDHENPFASRTRKPQRKAYCAAAAEIR